MMSGTSINDGRHARLCSRLQPAFTLLLKAFEYAEDADSGSNDGLNFPVIANVVQDGADLDLTIEVDLPAGWYRIEFFENPSGTDSTGFGEGEILLGAATINVTGAAGYETFAVTLTGVTPTQINQAAVPIIPARNMMAAMRLATSSAFVPRRISVPKTRRQ